MRLDKYLKVTRLIKRRTVANEACDAEKIVVNGKAARASEPLAALYNLDAGTPKGDAVRAVLAEQGIRAKDIVTMKSFENAIMVHAAISGSTNATMHLPAIAHEFGFTIDADTFDRMIMRVYNYQPISPEFIM